MNQQWHYSKDGAQHGPVDEEEIIRLIQNGELAPSTPVLKVGSNDWQPAREYTCFKVEIYPRRESADRAELPTSPVPPVVLTPPVASYQPTAGFQSTIGYRDASGMTKAVQIFLILGIILSAISILSSISQYSLLGKIERGDFGSEQEMMNTAAANDAREGLIGLAQIGLYTVTVIIAAFWINRASHNARSLGAKGMTFTPGWAVGWHFVPIANLWKPYEAMKEIWQCSQSPLNWQSQPINALLPIWWTFWIVCSLLGNFMFRASMGAKDIPELQAVTILNIISSLLDIPLSLIFMALITQIYRMQSSQIQTP